ncbi:hypothetical protein CK203_104243 [Vitis vinifera]|uniref:Uncharacterized protein n=1 Tax=Vitis vinifera TaxID=29760 RepID=A0A438FG12_VITVI|nr:hypothetical protein CK203_104243 [Vitis vinifera]
MVLQRCKKLVWGGGLEGHQKRLGEFSFSFPLHHWDGTRVKFWKDLWCGNQSLEEAFPILFNLSVNKKDGLLRLGRKTKEEVVGGFRFNRHLNDWEVGEVESLLSKLLP